MLQCAINSQELEVAYAAAQVWRSINHFLVAGRDSHSKPPDMPEYRVIHDDPSVDVRLMQNLFKSDHEVPTVTVDRMPQESIVCDKGILWRGGRISETDLKWFENRLANGASFPRGSKEELESTLLRSARAVATSQNRITAFKFMVWYGHPKDDAAYHLVLFRLRMQQPCDHSHALDFLSTTASEVEWLFSPFSAFRVVKVTRDLEFDKQQQKCLSFIRDRTRHELSTLSKYHLVELEVMPDNRTVAKDGPLPMHLPVAPWL